LASIERKLDEARSDLSKERSARARAEASQGRLEQELKLTLAAGKAKVDAIEGERRNGLDRAEVSRAKLEQEFKAFRDAVKVKIDAIDGERRSAVAAAGLQREEFLDIAQKDCDLLASDDYDPDRSETLFTGASLGDIRGPNDTSLRARAIASCRLAFEKNKDERYRYQLGRMLLADDDKTAEPLLIESANHGYSAAMALLGFAYREGTPAVLRDIDKSRKWYENAIAKGNPAAMVQRAYMLVTKDFGEQNLEKAEQLLLRAAQSETQGTTQPSARAAYVMLGHLHGGNPAWKKHSLQTDCKMAKDFYRKAVAGNKDPAFAFKYLAQWADKPPC
jgi:TPR repeat protein